MSGTIVVVSGTSGAGKTTVTQAFARRAGELYLMFGLDALVGTLFPTQYTLVGAKKREGFHGSFGDAGWKALQAMHEMIAAASRLGQSVVVDHMMFLDPPVLQDCVWRLEGRDVLFVNLTIPESEIPGRLAEKTRNRKLPATIGEPGMERGLADSLSELAPWFYERSYQNDCFDLGIDTTTTDPNGVCEQIEVRLAAGPGTAFEELRHRHPRPW